MELPNTHTGSPNAQSVTAAGLSLLSLPISLKFQDRICEGR